ncbi:polyprenyl synthetase family protein [Tenggerimyces flavus]|uniref:Polyprenyl synthetase family protein n=1 Tax=Tenggerimyces flavus TaxID=1708749 RepID=A0ABV7Y825_9ACTN|nr:polyprenyl synthetase family protein [Tenggerimyces flavus]MBM7788618.1 geranylgeranyl diphosphate synthase type I [Tenggerimyces flavus]
MSHSEQLRSRVEQELRKFLREQGEELTGVDDNLVHPLELLADLLAGGKRLRPAFCYWGWRGAGGEDGDEIVTAAAALELLQASAILHDDVMDDSDLRRGKPAAHRRFATLHRESGWSGSDEAFGRGGAILLGDLCLSWSDQMLRQSGLPAERLLPAMSYFDTMRAEVMAGQYLDLVIQGSGAESSLEFALRVLRFKSAKYTVERPLQLGGALAGGTPELLAAYSAYGLPLGEAFQLRDDILGVYGDPAVTGKPAGDDLREGKRTVLVAKTRENATPEQAERLEACLGDPKLTTEQVADAREIIVATGALAAVERLIDELTDQAYAALAAAPVVDDRARTALEQLVTAATKRSL